MDALRSVLRGLTAEPSMDRGASQVTDRTRRRIALLVSAVVLAWSALELANLTLTHTVGPELYGLLVAALAVGAGIANLLVLRSPRRRPWLAIAVILFWTLIALGGIAGTVAHVIGPVPGHGPVDLRPRPIAAPLIFTLLGLIGGAALWLGQSRAKVPSEGIREE